MELIDNISRLLGDDLKQTHVSFDQTMSQIDDIWTRVEVAMQDTIQLRRWLRSLGPDAVVEKPALLRKSLSDEFKTLVSLYNEANPEIADLLMENDKL